MDVDPADIERRAGSRRATPTSRSRPCCRPAWTTDWISEAGKRKLRDVRHRPARPRRAPAPVQLRLAVRCPQCGSPDTRSSAGSARPPARRCGSARRLPRAVRPLQGALACRPARCDAVRPRFHPLQVAAIDPLTDDAVAITFEVPAELADDYEFRAGQHLTGPPAGDDVRRSYSICTPAGVAALLRIGGEAAPGRRVLERRGPASCSVGDALEVMTPPAASPPRSTRPARSTTRDRRRLRDHAGALARRDDLRAASRAAGHAALRQPHAPVGDVRRGARRPQGPLPRPAAPGARALAGAAATSSCSPAGSTPTRLAPDPRPPWRRGVGRRVVPVRPVRDGRRAARTRCSRARRVAGAASTPSCSTSDAESRRRRVAELAGRRGAAARDDRPRRPPVDFRAAPRRRAGPRRRAAGARGRCRSPARAGSAAPAAPRSSRARSRWTPTARSSPTSSSAATCSPASRHPTVERVVLDYDA